MSHFLSLFDVVGHSHANRSDDTPLTFIYSAVRSGSVGPNPSSLSPLTRSPYPSHPSNRGGMPVTVSVEGGVGSNGDEGKEQEELMWMDGGVVGGIGGEDEDCCGSSMFHSSSTTQSSGDVACRMVEELSTTKAPPYVNYVQSRALPSPKIYLSP